MGATRFFPLVLVRIDVLDDLVLSVSVKLLLSRKHLVLHQVVHPQAQGYIVEKHVKDHLVEVEAQVILLDLETLELLFEHLQVFVAVVDELFSA